ncbi:MAG: serine kinase [Rikenellaceae bacterium]|nr:serine kinase [Rikenellaceae bacterium]
MTVKELACRLELKILTGEVGLPNEITGGYTSDLLSDVMGHAKEGQVWVTLQTHRNILGIATLKDLSAIILVKGFLPDEDTVAVAVEEGVPLLSTKDQAFEISGKLYRLLHP